MPTPPPLSIENPSLDKIRLYRKLDKISTELEDETIILDMDSGVYNGLDSVGTAIWRLLKHEIFFADLRQALMDEYDVEKNVCETDILSFLQKLASNGLITIT